MDIVMMMDMKKIDVDYSNLSDFDAWIALAREVESLFGPMADEAAFQEALKQAISDSTAFCIRSAPDERDKTLKGGVVVSKDANEIAWLAVSKQRRRRGYGRQLLEFAVCQLDRRKSMFVQTFAESVHEGTAARKLYLDLGFTDFKDGGLNPAGVPTVIMRLAESKLIGI